MDIQYKSVNTHNENGDRFVLTIDPEDNGVTIYDNHKRDGYGLYSGDDSKGFMGDGSKISKTNFQYLVDKLNELYVENQALKNDSEYHQIVMDKFDEHIKEWEFYFINSLERYSETDKQEDLLLHKAYGWTLADLSCIKDELQGEEYE